MPHVLFAVARIMGQTNPDIDKQEEIPLTYRNRSSGNMCFSIATLSWNLVPIASLANVISPLTIAEPLDKLASHPVF